jgi:beta-galactosidase
VFADFVPSAYVGYFDVSAEDVGETYIDTTGWGKGQLLTYSCDGPVNLGRYWPTVGPQMTLSSPVKSLLSLSVNFSFL